MILVYEEKNISKAIMRVGLPAFMWNEGWLIIDYMASVDTSVH